MRAIGANLDSLWKEQHQSIGTFKKLPLLHFCPSKMAIGPFPLMNQANYVKNCDMADIAICPIDWEKNS